MRYRILIRNLSKGFVIPLALLDATASKSDAEFAVRQLNRDSPGGYPDCNRVLNEDYSAFYDELQE